MIRDQERASVMGTVGNGYGREFVFFFVCFFPSPFLFHLANVGKPFC